MNTPQIYPEGLSVTEASRVAGIGRTKIYEAIAIGRLKARKYGKRTIILRNELSEFLSALPMADASLTGPLVKAR